ncbi:MAG: hypothetical protein HQK86_08185 [Nitrospinae bacterium]|nr:hypothetical protein [Nitrospinota bacterium]MBF0634134.1 hypothetical protein [Nitrospinota bacterium]
MKKSLTVLAVAALFISAGAVQAQGGAHMMGHDHGAPAKSAPAEPAKTEAKPDVHEHSHGAPGVAGKKESDLTMMQVMHDLAFQLNRVEFGIMTQNRRMIEEGANAIANHPMPKGGIKPYLKKNAEQIKAVIPAMDATIHGTATDMASHAAVAPMKDLQALYNVMAENCVSCHTVFRDQ